MLVTRQQVRHLAWAANDDVVALRGGWLWRSVTIAPVAKIQTVTAIESPFDRRAAMAGVRVDTAGGSELSHRVHIPYLAREIASALASSPVRRRRRERRSAGSAVGAPPPPPRERHAVRRPVSGEVQARTIVPSHR